jgi:thiamine-phosphate pyrophosphorylase
MRPLADCRLYTFVDTAYLHGREPEAVAGALCEGGSDLVQLRAKGLPVPAVRELALRILPVTRAAGVWLVINDHPDVAREVGAAVCHLGQEDFFDRGFTRVDELRAEGVLIGLSSHAPEQARRAVDAGAAYVAVGPVFATPTKPGRAAVTLDYVRWAAANLRVPWFAIGGINLATIEDVLAAGARRICVVSAILNRPDVAGACREFRQRLVSALA